MDTDLLSCILTEIQFMLWAAFHALREWDLENVYSNNASESEAHEAHEAS